MGIQDSFQVGGGESGIVVPDPGDPDIVYAGGYDGELARYDTRDGQLREIRPWPRNTKGLSG